MMKDFCFSQYIKIVLVLLSAMFFMTNICFAQSVTLKWNLNPESNLAGYLLHYKVSSPGEPYNGTGAAEGDSPIDVGKVTQFTINLQEGQIYYLAVTAYTDGIPSLESAYSNTVSFPEETNTYSAVFSAGFHGRLVGVVNQTVIGGGDCTSVSAVPDEYYRFVGWSGDYNGNDNPLTLTNINQDMTLRAIFAVIDSDMDGISTLEEMGPAKNDPSYDGNSDGIPDSQQDDVASFYTVNEEGKNIYVTLAASGGYNAITMYIDRVPEDPVLKGGTPTEGGDEVQFPFGFYEFIITCLTCAGNSGEFRPEVTLFLPENAAPNTYQKYGPTPDNNTDHWYRFIYDSEIGVGAEIAGNVVTLYFIDGEKGDDDLIDDNGEISDIGGPGVEADLRRNSKK